VAGFRSRFLRGFMVVTGFMAGWLGSPVMASWVWVYPVSSSLATQQPA
jgi:hypothetical protein